MKRLFNLALHGVLMAGSFFFALAMVEVFCRAVVDNGMHYHLEMWKYANALKEVAPNRDIGHQHVPGSAAHLMGVDVVINEDGLRDSYSDGLDQDATRILMLGDSITFGWGVSEQNTVASRLERLLQSDFNATVEVINAGVGNYNTAMEAAWFADKGQNLQPDAVVLNVFINDAEETPMYRSVSWLDQTAYSRVILFGAFDTLSRTLFGGPVWKDYYTGLYNDQSTGWAEMQEAFAHLVALCRTADIPLVVVDYPELRELNPYPFADVSMKIADMAKNENIPYIPLLRAVEDADPRSLWVTEPDPHPNEHATELMAAHLAPKLWEVLGVQLKR